MKTYTQNVMFSILLYLASPFLATNILKNLQKLERRTAKMPNSLEASVYEQKREWPQHRQPFVLQLMLKT